MAQYQTYNDYTGNWTDASSWSTSYPGTTGINNGANIYGDITSNQAIEFNKGTLTIYDTLRIYGDLTLGNNADLAIEDGAVVFIYGNLNIANKVDISANSYLVITGDFNKSGSSNQGSFTGDNTPYPVYILGDVNPSDLGDDPDFPVLDCGSDDPNTEYDSTDCNYGGAYDIQDSPVNDLFQEGCSTPPTINSISSNSPLFEGETINLTSSASPGSGATTVNYSWKGPNSYTASGANQSIASATTAMSGYYVLTAYNELGCSVKDSVYVDVQVDCCSGFNYYSKDNYTGTWNDMNSWASPNEGWRPLPPPTDGTSTGSSQALCIKGYITLNGDYTVRNTDVKICDTLVITGNLDVSSMSLEVTSSGILIVLGDFVGSNGSLTNAGEIIVAGNFEKPYSYSFSNSSEIYVFDDTPLSEGFTPTGDETTLENNNPNLNDFYNSVVCGAGVDAGTIATDQTICPGDDVAGFTSISAASPSSASYQWYESTNSSDPASGTWNLISGATGETYDHDTVNQTTYFYRKATIGSGCDANSNVVTITTYTPPTPDIGTDQEVCEGITVTLDAGSYNSYSWSTGASTQTLDITAVGTNSYTVTVTDANGCTGESNTVNVTINSNPTPSLTGDNFVCEDEMGIVYSTESGMSNYSWNITGGTITAGGTNTDNTATVTWTNPGARSISVNYENADGCSASVDENYNVTVNNTPVTDSVYRNPNN